MSNNEKPSEIVLAVATEAAADIYVLSGAIKIDVANARDRWHKRSGIKGARYLMRPATGERTCLFISGLKGEARASL